VGENAERMDRITRYFMDDPNFQVKQNA